MYALYHVRNETSEMNDTWCHISISNTKQKSQMLIYFVYPKKLQNLFAFKQLLHYVF